MSRIFYFVFVCCALTSAVHAQFLGQDFVTGTAAGATATGTNSTAVGATATASGDDSSAFGSQATATGLRSTALGHDSLASGEDSTAVGLNANATAIGATSIGRTSRATGDFSTSLGRLARADGDFSTALGDFAFATGVSSTAVGRNAAATFDNSMAIGADTFTTRDNQVIIGRNTNNYTTPGIASASSRTAQTGPTQFVTTDAAGNLAATDFTTMGVASTGQVDDNTEGVAMAMALSGVPNILPEGTVYGVSMDWGNFGGENAVALGGSVRVVDNIFFNGGGAVGTNRGNGGGRAGVTVAW